MNDFLGRLAQRALAPAPAVRPRLASPFEPLAGAAGAAPAEFDPQPAAESPFARPTATDSPGAVRLGHDESGPHETAIRLASVTPLAGSKLAPTATANPLPLPASAERGAGRGEGNDPPKRPAAPRPAPPPAGAEGESMDHLLAPPPDSTAAGRGPRPSGASPRLPIPPATAGADRFSPSPTGEARPAPRRADAQPAPLAGDDTSSSGPPMPGAIPPPAASRIIHPHVRLPGAATLAADAGRATAPAVKAAAAAAPPDVHITIGRVEIRAVTPPAAPRATSRPAPRVSLDDYLQQTAGGRR